MTSQLVVDATMRDQMKNTEHTVEVCDEDGKVLGVFYPSRSQPRNTKGESAFHRAGNPGASQAKDRSST